MVNVVGERGSSGSTGSKGEKQWSCDEACETENKMAHAKQQSQRKVDTSAKQGDVYGARQESPVLEDGMAVKPKPDVPGDVG